VPIYLDNDDPQPRDIIDSWRPDTEADAGWMNDTRWTARRIILTAIVLIGLIALVAGTMVGVVEFVSTLGNPPPTLPPTPVLPLV
jgi:hypothetical protein